MAYRAFFALPAENFSTTTGQHTNAVYGFTSMLINVLRDEEPTHVGVAFDVSRQTFRTQEYAEYKAGRSATPDEFKGQVSLLREVLDAAGERTTLVHCCAGEVPVQLRDGLTQLGTRGGGAQPLARA